MRATRIGRNWLEASSRPLIELERRLSQPAGSRYASGAAGAEAEKGPLSEARQSVERLNWKPPAALQIGSQPGGNGGISHPTARRCTKSDPAGTNGSKADPGKKQSGATGSPTTPPIATAPSRGSAERRRAGDWPALAFGSVCLLSRLVVDDAGAEVGDHLHVEHDQRPGCDGEGGAAVATFVDASVTSADLRRRR